MKKKLLSALLCVCMVLTMFPSMTFVTAGDTQETVNVMDAPYNAKGDGTTNDREAIQKAIDTVYAAGGGTVTLPAGKTFLSGNIILKSNVTLHFEDGAILKQSASQGDYVKPDGDGYAAYQPEYGHNTIEGVRWGHAWYENYPLVYAGEGTENIKITGNGTIEMTPGASCVTTLHMCPVGLYRVSNFEISDITITKCSNYGMMPYTCNNGLIKNVKMMNFVDANGDGISLQNCQDIRITGCNLDTTDDTIYIFTSYADPRGGTWWSSDEPQPSKNIEIDHNKCYTTCKAFGFILWGEGCPDQSLVEASNVYVHDNVFSTMGIWYNDPFVGGSDTSTPSPTPIKNIRFENNTITKIQENFYQTPISDMNLYACMTEMLNGDFEDKESYWTILKNEDDKSAGVSAYKAGQQGTYFGCLQNLDKGDAKIYQGLRFEAGKTYNFTANVQSSGASCRMFVRNLDTQELVASKEFNNTSWAEQTLTFEVPETGNYHIGIERGNATEGYARIDSASVSMKDEKEQSILTTQVPDKYGSDTYYELGTRFKTTVDGTITKVRIYTNENESGIHTVRLWDYKAKKVIAGPYEWDVPAGTTGWQEFELPTPVSVEADKDYVVAVSNNAETKYYAQGTEASNSFASSISNRNLVSYAKGGLWSRNAGDMPYNQTNTNYFRDVVFVSDEQTILTTQTPTDFDSKTGPYELGTRFKVAKDGFITKVRIYTHEKESGIHTVRIWDRNRRQVVAGPYEWDVQAGTTGWQEFELPTAVSIEADKDYIVAVSSNSSTLYYPRGLDSNNSFATPITNGDLVTYVSSGLFSVNLGDMPYRTKDNCNYFRDVVFVVDKADRTELQGLVDVYKNVQQNNYTDDSWKAVVNALTEAQKVLADVGATQNEVDVAVDALQTAIFNLENAKVVNAPTIEIAESTFNYDGKAKTPTVTVKDGATAIAASEYEVEYKDNVNAGTATITIKDKIGGNYVVSGTKTFVIKPAAITITADNKEAYVGDNKPTLTYSVSGLLNDDKLVKEPALSCEADMNSAGEYDITASGADAGDNYTVNYAKGTLKVKEVDKNDLKKLFDDNKNVQKSDYTEDSWKVFEKAMEEAQKVVDDKTPTPDEVKEATKNLQAAVEGLTKIKVVNAPVIEIAEITFKYDGKAKTPVVTVKDGETVIAATEYEVEYKDNVNAGTATITIKDKTGGNYAVSGTKTFVIKPATVTITLDNKNAYVGDSKPELTYKVSGLLNGDKLTVEPTLSCDADMDKAGEYEITASKAEAGDNYTVAYANGMLYVKEKVNENENGGGNAGSGTVNNSGTTDNNAGSTNNSSSVNNTSVATGDTSSIALWGVLLLAAFAGMLQLLRLRFSKEKN